MSAANFKRPIVILGPLNDIALEKLSREMPDDYEVAGWFLFLVIQSHSIQKNYDNFFCVLSLPIFYLYINHLFFMAEMVPRSGGGDGGSTVIKLDAVRRIAEKVSQSQINK